MLRASAIKTMIEKTNAMPVVWMIFTAAGMPSAEKIGSNFGNHPLSSDTASLRKLNTTAATQVVTRAMSTMTASVLGSGLRKNISIISETCFHLSWVSFLLLASASGGDLFIRHCREV
jgi:hypothetical protein